MAKRDKQPEHIPGVPDKPTTNGHYMGASCGFDYEDGAFTIAPALRTRIDELIDERQAIEVWMRAQNTFAQEQIRKNWLAERAWWSRMKEELGHALEGYNYSFGRLSPVKEKPVPHSCLYCELQNFPGKEALIAHHGVCPKNPWLGVAASPEANANILRSK